MEVMFVDPQYLPLGSSLIAGGLLLLMVVGVAPLCTGGCMRSLPTRPPSMNPSKRLPDPRNQHPSARTAGSRFPGRSLSCLSSVRSVIEGNGSASLASGSAGRKILVSIGRAVIFSGYPDPRTARPMIPFD